MAASRFRQFARSPQGLIAEGALAAIAAALVLGAAGVPEPRSAIPLYVIVGLGGAYLLVGIAREMFRQSPGADVLAAISIICAAVMGQWHVAAIIVLMLSGGEALETVATSRASAVLDALARRSPELAHRLAPGRDEPADIRAGDIAIGDLLVVYPHELCPVDGEVVDGHGTMDESYLTGEPYELTKSVGSTVLSGAVNGEDALTVRAVKLARDSRYAQIVGVLTEAEARRPHMRRLADRLGMWYAPLAIALGAVGWLVSGEPSRFLAVVVIATPCPLLIGVPVAIIGAISLAAKAGIIIKDPGVLERISTAKTMLFDKTGTLTYGRPELTVMEPAPGWDADEALALAAAVERYSRHPLAGAIIEAAKARDGVGGGADDGDDGGVGGGESAHLPKASAVSEKPGKGLTGVVEGRRVHITNRAHALEELGPGGADGLPATVSGMECVVIIDGRYAATFRFRDTPRASARSFVEHLGPKHGIDTTVMVSGDATGEADYVARLVGIQEVHAQCAPEEKLAIVRRESAARPTIFLGDGVNDAPAMTAATVGIAFGQESDVTTEAAGAVILDSSLARVDELLHIGARMRTISLQSVIGGMALSAIGMGFAVFGLLPPVLGAIAQECVDLLAILNAARVPLVRGTMTDFQGYAAGPVQVGPVTS
jgi:heavy metal translocating P-type ATPase